LQDGLLDSGVVIGSHIEPQWCREELIYSIPLEFML